MQKEDEILNPPTFFILSSFTDKLMINNISTQTTPSLSTLNYQLGSSSKIYIALHDQEGNMRKILLDDFHEKGLHRLCWDPSNLGKGSYFIHIRMPNRRLVKKIDV